MDNPGRLQHKLIRGNTKILDEDEGTVNATVSTEAKDRDGDIIRVAGWDLTNFLKHPVLLTDHDYRSLSSLIGEWSDMKAVRGNPKRMDGTAKFFINDGNAKADWGFTLARRGIAAFSVGFIPDMDKAKILEGGNEFWGPFEFNGQEMLETSQVTIPAHPDALQRMKGLDKHPVIQELVEELLGEEPDGPADLETLLAAMAKRLFAESETVAQHLAFEIDRRFVRDVDDDPEPTKTLINFEACVAAMERGVSNAINGG